MRFVIFVRHGQPDIPEGVYPDHGKMGLSSLGKIQAEEISKAFSNLRVDRIVSSHLPRAVQTIKPLSLILGCEIDLVPNLRERTFEELYGFDFDEIQSLHGPAIRREIEYGNTDLVELEKAETLEESVVRLCKSMSDIVISNIGTTIVSSHGGPHDWYLSSLSGTQFSGRLFKIGYGRATVISYPDDSSKPYRVEGVNLPASIAATYIESEAER